MSQRPTAQYYDGKSAVRHEVTVQIEQRSNGSALMIIEDDQVLDRWSLSNLRELQDQARETGIVVETLEQPTARLIISDDRFADALRANCPDLNHRPVGAPAWRRLVLWGGGAIASVLLIMFVIVPGLANQMAPLIPLEREKQMGQASLHQIAKFMGGKELDELTCSSPAGDAALDKMVARLSEHADTVYDFDVRVFDIGVLNAFAVPGGHIVLFEGLILEAESAEEVIGVLGHEMGHVVNRDSTRMALRSAGSVGILGLIFGDFTGGAAALILAEQLIAASYAQEAEASADFYATELLSKADLPTGPFADFFLKLIGEDDEGGGLMSHLASHPDSRGRSDATRAANTVEGEYEPVLNDEEWAALRAICKTAKRTKPVEQKSRNRE